jgi:hypothetical protein
MPYTWEDIPDDIKARLPAPPIRGENEDEEEWLERRAYWQGLVGRLAGPFMRGGGTSKLPASQSRENADPPKLTGDDG